MLKPSAESYRSICISVQRYIQHQVVSPSSFPCTLKASQLILVILRCTTKSALPEFRGLESLRLDDRNDNDNKQNTDSNTNNDSHSHIFPPINQSNSEVWGEGTYHICLRTRLAPRRNPCADTARLSIYQFSTETGYVDAYQSCPVVHLAFHPSRRLLWCSGAWPDCQLTQWLMQGEGQLTYIDSLVNLGLNVWDLLFESS